MRIHSDAKGVSVPTAQAETAVVGWRVRWIDERRGQTPRRPMVTFDKNEAVRWEISGYSVDALVVQQAPVSTGEQPGMSEPNWFAEWQAVSNPRIEEGKAHEEALYQEREYSKKLLKERDEWIVELIRERDEAKAAPTLPDDLLSLSEAATAGEWSMFRDDTGGAFTGWPSIIAPEERDASIVHRAGFKQEFWGDWSEREAVANAALIVASVNFIRTLAAKQGGQK